MRYNLNRHYTNPVGADYLKAEAYFKRERKKGLFISIFQEDQVRQVFAFFRLNGEKFMKTQSCFIKVKKMIEASAETFFVQRLIHSQRYGLATSNPVRHLILYGVAGICNYNKYVEFQSEKNKLEYKQRVHGMTEEEFRGYNLSRAVTLENCISRHGEEKGSQIFWDYCEKQRDSGCSLQWFQKVHGEEKGAEIYKRVNEQKGRSVSSYMKYKGMTFEEAVVACELSSRNLNSHLSGNMANEFFRELDSNISDVLSSKSLTAYKTHEFGMYDPKTDNITRFDYAIPEFKLIIEFNGNYWHMNPKMYSHSELRLLHSVRPFTAAEIWERDKHKNSIATDAGYQLFVIWESDYNEDPRGTVEYYAGVINEIARAHRV